MSATTSTIPSPDPTSRDWSLCLDNPILQCDRSQRHVYHHLLSRHQCIHLPDHRRDGRRRLRHRLRFNAVYRSIPHHARSKNPQTRLRLQPRKHVPRGHQRDLSRIRLVRPISRGRPSSPGCSCTVPPQVVVGGYPERDSCSCNLRDDHDLAHSASPSCVFNGTSNANDFDHYRRDRSDCTDRLQHDLACSQYQEYSW